MAPERPSAREREWLLSRLGHLIGEIGFERMVSAALVEISDAWFPDRWSASPAGVHILLRRLFWHAGLPDVEVVVEDLRDEPQLQSGTLPSEVFYVHHAEGRVVFDLYRIGTDDLIGILCHQVGVACLDLFAIGQGPRGPFREGAPADEVGPDRQALASLATVYIGLGVPAANAAQTGRWTVTRAGGLPVQALAYLLAVQQVVRDRPNPAYDALGTNQRADFDEWCEELAGSRKELIRSLGLPPESEWPPVSSSLTLVPFDFDHEADEQLELRRVREVNRGHPVYRIPGNDLVRGGALGLLSGGAAALALASIAPPMAIAALATLTVAGLLIGHRRRYEICSHRACATRLPPGVETCPHCAGTIAGRLEHRDDRLDEEGEPG